MILKKPYAFLIKYYRIIHLGLAFLLGVGAYKLLDVINFFNEYVKNGYTTTVVTDLEKIYTPFSLFLIVFLIIIFTSSITILLVHKKKPVKLYALMISYYLCIFLGLFYVSATLQSFETELLASTLARSLRDIFTILYLPQFLFVIFIVLRTIGFNVKKFVFADDRQELVSGESDSEEFEFNVNFEGYKVKQKVNRSFREVLYYIKENKFVVLCIVIVLGIGLSIFVYKNVDKDYDLNYKMGNTFVFNNLNVTIKDAIVTNLDYNGNVIDDNYYLVLKMNVTNNSGYAISMDYNNFKLIVGRNAITPSVNLAYHFVDFAAGEIPTSVSHKADKTFALVYKINESQSRKNMKLRIHNGSLLHGDEYVYRQIFVKIDPLEISGLSIVGNYMQKQKVDFSDTYLGNTELTINSYLVDKSYVYEHTSCDKYSVCEEYIDAITVPVTGNRHTNKLIVMSVDYSQDLETAYAQGNTSLYSFAENYMKIQYKVGNTVYSDKSINVTPIKSSDLLAFEVPQDIDNASIVQAIIVIRNKEYIINLQVMH